ncbi:hypothetical protein A6V37_37990 [Paraburkholderia ginsengiterrae]|uniref:Uncharacterized protein n=1 Tax=Paraburkholderia ginsengiterrae TaxID=1462993 RepID=A0A1A9NAK8_9BURK|nr:hypothetical protein A6V37_37990 [Paraburkholderia ginsengiterrae]
MWRLLATEGGWAENVGEEGGGRQGGGEWWGIGAPRCGNSARQGTKRTAAATKEAMQSGMGGARLHAARPVSSNARGVIA